MIDFGELDNPVWHSRTIANREILISKGLARRYLTTVSPMAGLFEPTPQAFSDLRDLVAVGEVVALLTAEHPRVLDNWNVVRARPLEQMVCTKLNPTSSAVLEALTQRDVPDMLALTAATEPGPFLEGTVRMGRYHGIRSADGKLIAMAGERLNLNRFTEISAVCTSPQFRGRGHAASLVAFLAARILNEGNTPFLHVTGENPAKSLYARIGFEFRRQLHLTVMNPR